MKTQIGVGIFVIICAVMAQAKEPIARAAEFKSTVVYRPPENPGFAAWVMLWREPPAVSEVEPKGDLLVKFIERRKPRDNERVATPKLDPDFWEAVGLPVGYDFGGLVTQAVYMRSSDGGATWKEVNRTGETELNRAPDSGCMTPIALEDGRLLSLSWGMPGCLRESRDMGSSWTIVRELMDPQRYETAAFAHRVLNDKKTLVIICPFQRAWGPGKPTAGRLHYVPGQRNTYQCSLLFSSDFGKTLAQPMLIFPGVPVTEPDFCEMPNGDLLFLQNALFGGVAHRQTIRKTKYGYVPEQMETIGKDAPEIFVRTKDGYLVGASRNAPYVWSDDDGMTWYPLQDAPRGEYQPRAMMLDDDRILFVWHQGGDLPYGQADMFIGAHTFKLKVDQQKQRTNLTLSRTFDAKKDKYITAFEAKLMTTDGKTVQGKEIEFAIVGRDEPGYEPFGGSTPWVKGKRQTAKTDENGIARIAYPEQAGITAIHRTFQIAARFDPERKDDELHPSTSLVIEYYAMTPN
jgi:hypothetical protein